MNRGTLVMCMCRRSRRGWRSSYQSNSLSGANEPRGLREWSSVRDTRSVWWAAADAAVPTEHHLAARWASTTCQELRTCCRRQPRPRDAAWRCVYICIYDIMHVQCRNQKFVSHGWGCSLPSFLSLSFLFIFPPFLLFSLSSAWEWPLEISGHFGER